ncbi:hypothetical protein OnM2_034027 [Erysiphe neolycopersici]|uniref:Autophagy-related protein 33 n=1 Tax=Erysiphe neolycopersici TaxID=212602 RepID=A0A420HXY3_9PEZI|nr:hypothetical protein OnM2_034027 [Erysiphe neolycopersici]
MTERLVRILKLSGVVSLGFLAGFSCSLSTLALPIFMSNCNQRSSSQDIKEFSNRSINLIRTFACFSSSSFFIAFFFAPNTQKHPYLLWTSLLVGSSFLVDLIPNLVTGLGKSTLCQGTTKNGKASSRHNNQLDASYEVLTKSSHSDDEIEDSESIKSEACAQIKSQLLLERIRTAFTGVGFAMSIVGIWGDRFNSFTA